MIIRKATALDAKELLEIYSPYVEETAISFELVTPTIEDFTNRISKISAEYPYLVAVSDDRIVGYAYASVFHGREAYKHCVETSIYIHKDCRGKGIGRELYNALEIELLKQNVYTLYACITKTDREEDSYLTNSSILFHERLGYRLTGVHELCGYKFGRWYSVCWMEKRISDLPDNPPKFIPYCEIDRA